MLNRRTMSGILIFTMLVPVLLLGQGYVQQTDQSGAVDWTNQLIRATGIGAPNPNLPMAAQRAGALRAAKLEALRNLLEMVKGLALTSETTVEDAMISSDVINTRVEGAVRGFRVVDTRYMSTGDVEVDVEVPMTGIVLDAVLGESFGGGALLSGAQLVCPTCGQPWPAGKPVPPGVNLVSIGDAAGSTSSPNAVYSGLIIDARGLGLRPAMAPKVLDEGSQEIYGTKFVNRDYAVDIGMVGYEKDMGRARSNERVASNALIVKAIRAAGPNKTDVVVATADAAKIHNAAANMNFLQQCKVMFILD